MIRVGLIGYGNYGKKYYDSIINDKKFKIIKILKKKKISSKLFTNNKNKFFKIKKIDLYIIASPTYTHFEYLNMIMKKNKHIIVEKPFIKSREEFLKLKDKLKKYKKIILINHTDLYSKTLLKIKEKIKKTGKIKSVSLIYGKKDPYLFNNVKTSSDLPFYEWLSHPLAIINNFFKNYKFDKIVESKQFRRGKFIIQNLKIVYLGKKFNIKIHFSNDYKLKKRNLIINGSKYCLIYKGYSNLKGCYLIKNKKINLTVKNDNPIQNLLENFKSKYHSKKIRDDRKIIYQTTNQLLSISNEI